MGDTRGIRSTAIPGHLLRSQAAALRKASILRGKMLDLDDYRAGLADRTRMMRVWNLFPDGYPLELTPFLIRATYPWNYDAQGRTQTNGLFDSAVYFFWRVVRLL